jgi:hypothetical protein
MKFAKMLGAAAVAAMALMAFAGTASATTLEIGGVTQNRAVTLHATIRSGNTAALSDPFRISVNTCSESTVHGETTTFTARGTGAIGGPIRTLTFSRCSYEGPNREGVVVHRAGSLSVEWISGTTNGTVRSSGAEVTVPSEAFGTVTCTTSNTDIGTLTGVRSGQATFDIRGNLSCTKIGTGVWSGTYTVTTPEGLGVEE